MKGVSKTKENNRPQIYALSDVPQGIHPQHRSSNSDYNGKNEQSRNISERRGNFPSEEC